MPSKLPPLYCLSGPLMSFSPVLTTWPGTRSTSPGYEKRVFSCQRYNNGKRYEYCALPFLWKIRLTVMCRAELRGKQGVKKAARVGVPKGSDCPHRTLSCSTGHWVCLLVLFLPISHPLTSTLWGGLWMVFRSVHLPPSKAVQNSRGLPRNPLAPCIHAALFWPNLKCCVFRKEQQRHQDLFGGPCILKGFL